MTSRDASAAPGAGRRSSDLGFTLVELLVVMIIIGILAAVAIPTFLSHKQKAHETTAKSDVEEIAKEVVAFYIDGTGAITLAAGPTPSSWQLLSGAQVVAEGLLSPGNAVGTPGAISSDSSYCVAVVPSADGTRGWRATEAGLALGDCGTP